ncbi:hypothetical protein SAMN05421676_10638 [Salinibacillus kushneri]|uniref:Uncharacterized protein n=1 Tax=Salinibacillus kushneri TaxID=237682 RepID=A0A1I0FS34_9BACI|nr:hypothetical protein [Salinibacillus kushneri]SET60178.1 hypothetical protein SAMN05421676_10638 [Salinibacillus kushneri]
MKGEIPATMDDGLKQVGITVKRKCIISLLLGFLLLGILMGSFGITSTMFVLPIGGIGDFYVKFDTLKGEGFSMNPYIEESGDSSEAPLIRSSFQSVTIYGLHLYKDFHLPNGKWIRVNIHANQPTEIEGLIQDARFIEANLHVDEMMMNPSGFSEENDILTKWVQNEQSVTITEGEMVTDYLFQNMVTVNGIEFSIDMHSGHESTKSSSTDQHKHEPVESRNE